MAANCKEPNCTRPAIVRSYCQRHYRRHRRHETLHTKRPIGICAEPQGPTCGICGHSVYEHGVTEWCHVDQRIRYATTQRT